jgi:hypothetical protein
MSCHDWLAVCVIVIALLVSWIATDYGVRP